MLRNCLTSATTLALLLGARLALAADSAPAPSAEIQKWCSDLRAGITAFHWKLDPCENLEWKVGAHSVDGRPLVYTEFGDLKSQNITLVLSMVHGDENTPLYLAIKMAHWMRDNQDTFSKLHVVIAPLLNPDGFYSKPKTRTNSHGVDVNRNLATADWQAMALKLWKEKFKSNPRRFPGSAAHSEPETVFQEELIQKFRPTKILSIHAPLNFMDYDGPSTLTLARFPKDYVQECLKLRNRMKAISGGFFPGSLGNYAGQELGIPTMTLELPTADPAKAEGYWFNFKRGIRAMIEYAVPNIAFKRNTAPSS